MTAIAGIHHITAIAGSPQDNADFYVRTLGQRLVKKTVNFDAPDTYHLYYGDRTGSPGTILTFFPFVDAGPGRAGPGMADAVAYALSSRAFEAAMERLADAGTSFDGPFQRFGERVIALKDPDGLCVEMVETTPAEGGDGAFHSVTLWLDDPEPTRRLLMEIFGYREAGTEETEGLVRHRLVTAEPAPAQVVDLKRDASPSLGRQGAGTIHHVAFRARDDAEQVMWRERLAAAGYDVTPVIDRQYFNAIYFREPGGVLFEIATDPPGFAVDEPVEALGTGLKLPERYEPIRERIERTLPPLEVPA